MTEQKAMGASALEQGFLLKVPPMPQDAWAKLYGSLRQAIEIQKAGFEYKDAPSGAMAAEAGLQAVINFLQNCPELMNAGAVGPLLTLSAALRDIQEGRRPTLLLPRRAVPGRPGTSEVQATVIGFAARTMTEMMNSGKSAQNAANAVSKAMKMGKAAGWKKASPATIKNWRARCEEGAGSDISPRARQHYIEPLPIGMGDSSATRAENLLLILSEATARGFGE